MKKTLIASIVVIFSLIHSFGQVGYGIKTGLNLSNSKNIGSADNKSRLAFNGGLLAEIGLSKQFFIQPEILLFYQGL